MTAENLLQECPIYEERGRKIWPTTTSARENYLGMSKASR
jgi:hypothetical protein